MSDDASGCIVVGGGPAGMIAGLLLARAGIHTTVFEKHGDFLRDFRGDTIHCSTQLLLEELGLGEQFRRIPYSRLETARVPAADGTLATIADFRRLRHPYPYIAIAPQWDFLDLLADAGRAEPCFHLRMHTEVTGLIRRGTRISGVRFVDHTTGSQGAQEALLTIAADGRGSRVRRLAGLEVHEFGAPLDVLWFRIPVGDTAGRAEGIGQSLTPRGANGRLLVLIPRGEYVQAGLLIPKGEEAAIRAEGVEAFRATVAAAVPELAASAAALRLEDVHGLDVRLNRAGRWWTRGLLCIGDAAHAMSPVAGVGVNLAVQDGVAAARLLARPLRTGRMSDDRLAAVQRRRELPTAVTQAAQRIAHRGLRRAFRVKWTPVVPTGLARLLRALPGLTAIPARLVGIGALPEHAPDFARR